MRYYINFKEDIFNKNEILTTPDGFNLKVIKTPHRKWYRRLLQFVSFGLYRIPTHYTCMIL